MSPAADIFFFPDLHTHNTHTHTHTYTHTHTHTHTHTLMSAWIASTSVVSSSLVLSYVIHITVLHLVLYKRCLFFFGAFFLVNQQEPEYSDCPIRLIAVSLLMQSMWNVMSYNMLCMRNVIQHSVCVCVYVYVCVCTSSS